MPLGTEIMFNIIPALIIVFVIGGIIFSIVKGIGRWSYNNSQPVLTVPAKVVTKRADVTNRAFQANGNIGHRTHTMYFVTFQVESGDRLELQVNGNEYGFLVENDAGKLTFQGTRYLDFVREF